MVNAKAFVQASDDYMRKQASLHEEDSEWKSSKIVPFADGFMQRYSEGRLIVHDAGGGAGRIVALACDHLGGEWEITADKTLLGLSRGALQVQAEANPDGHACQRRDQTQDGPEMGDRGP
jgi:hypothetical protein